jgi:membrane-associated protein
MDLQAMIEWALAGLAAYGYPIVFFAMTLESIFVLGSFTPGDLITAAAAVAAATNPLAKLSPWWLVATAASGSVIGANISYIIGYRGGRDLIERVGPRFGMDIKTIEAAEEFFGRRGSETIFLARFVAVMKNVAPVLAGASRMNLFWFELYTLLSALVYAGVMVGVGWFLGDNFRVGLKFFGAFSWLLLVAVIAGVITITVAKRRRDKRLIAREAAAFEEEHPELHEPDRW